MTADETARAIKSAKTDTDRSITYDPQGRPEVANLLRLAAACTGESPGTVAERVGDGGGGKLKAVLTEALNAKLAPIRERRARYTRKRMGRRVTRAASEPSSARLNPDRPREPSAITSTSKRSAAARIDSAANLPSTTEILVEVGERRAAPAVRPR